MPVAVLEEGQTRKAQAACSCHRQRRLRQVANPLSASRAIVADAATWTGCPGSTVKLRGHASI